MYILKDTTSYKRKPLKGGFTMVETLVSVAIFTIVAGAILGSIASSMQTLSEIRNKLTSMYLAEDAIEYIKNMREEYSVLGDDWLGDDPATGAHEGLGECVVGNLPNPNWGCTVDTTKESNDALALVTRNPDALLSTKLRYNSGTGFYGYALSDSMSPFARSVRLVSLDPSGTGDFDEVRVEVKVSWPSRGSGGSFTLYYSMFDWK